MARSADEDPLTVQLARVEEAAEAPAPGTGVPEPARGAADAAPVAVRAPDGDGVPFLALVRGTGVVRVALGIAAALVIAHFTALVIGAGRPGFVSLR